MPNLEYQFAIDPNLIATFLAVARAGKIAAAAELIHLSQPAVTAQIAKLEGQLEFPLFRRSVKGVELTVQGRAFLDYAREISRLLRKASDIERRQNALSGELQILASTTIGNHVLPKILCEFAVNYPKLMISLGVLSTSEVIERIHAGKAVLGLVEGPSRIAQLRLTHFADDELVLVAHPEVGGPIRRLENLKSETILWREKGSGTRAVVEKALKPFFTKSDLRPRIELGSSEAIKTAILNKVGVGFLSRWSVHADLASGRMDIVNFEELKIRRNFSWVLSSGSPGQLEREFMSFAQSKVKGLFRLG